MDGGGLSPGVAWVGLGYLALSIASSVVIVVWFRCCEARRRDRLVVVAANYIVATGAAALGWWAGGRPGLAGGAIALGVVTGILFVVTFLLLGEAIGRLGLALPVAASRLAPMLPVLVSIVVYGERPGTFGVAGLSVAGLAIAAMVAAAMEQSGVRRISWVGGGLLLALCFGMGLGQVSMKVFQELFPAGHEAGFLAWLFGTALVAAWWRVLATGRRVRRDDVLAGLVLGIPNVCSSLFMLQALRRLPGIMVFPVNDAGVVVVSTAVGLLWWRERPGCRSWVALALSLAAILLLNISLA